MTRNELEQYDGTDGKPAYIGYKGKVYDVTNSKLWKNGVHCNSIESGKDYTDKLGMAPHGEESILKMPVVDDLTD